MPTDIRNHISFQADFDDGDLYPQGKNLSGYLADCLMAKGIVTQPHEIYEDFAWSFFCIVADKKFMVLVGKIDDEVREWLVCSEPAMGILSQLLRKPSVTEHQLLNRALQEILSSNQAFQNIRWYTENDWNQQPDEQWFANPE